MTVEARLRRPTAPAVAIRPLTPDDVGHLRLDWRNRYGADEIRAIVARYPGRSVWTPETREFAVVGPWRHREEIATILELAAVRHVEPLIAGAVERCRAAGAALVVVTDLDELRRPAFYTRIGFELLEEVITYELDHLATRDSDPGPLRFALVEPDNAPQIAELVRIDHTAFPWLWWNSEQEFRTYLRTPAVELFLGYLGTTAVSYLGVTTYAGWGHLDRIAVDPAYQGRRLGWHSLAFATMALARNGVLRIGLSTQRENTRSQQLYERYGFRRSRLNDYRLYGVTLDEPPGTTLDAPPGTTLL